MQASYPTEAPPCMRAPANFCYAGRRAHSFVITKRILRLDGLVGGERLGFALVVDRLDAEEILVTFLQALHRAVGGVRRGAAHRHPLPRLLVHLLHQVFFDRQAAVVLWRPPVELTAVLGDAVHFQWSHGGAGPSQEDQFNKLFVLAVNVGGGELVALLVLPRARLHNEVGFVGLVSDGDVAGGRHFDSHQGPHRFGRWLAGHVDVKFDSAAHLGRSCCHVRPVDPGLH